MEENEIPKHRKKSKKERVRASRPYKIYMKFLNGAFKEEYRFTTAKERDKKFEELMIKKWDLIDYKKVDEI